MVQPSFCKNTWWRDMRKVAWAMRKEVPKSIINSQDWQLLDDQKGILLFWSQQITFAICKLYRDQCGNIIYIYISQEMFFQPKLCIKCKSGRWINQLQRIICNWTFARPSFCRSWPALWSQRNVWAVRVSGTMLESIREISRRFCKFQIDVWGS